MIENSAKTKEIIEKIFRDLMAMPNDEFEKFLEEHKDGEIAQLLLYADADCLNPDNYIKKEINNDETLESS